MKIAKDLRVWYNELHIEGGKRSALEIQGIQDFDTASLDELRNMRKIYLGDEVDDKILSLQRLLLRWNMEDAGKPIQARKTVILYICSYGGDRDYMWSLVDLIHYEEAVRVASEELEDYDEEDAYILTATDCLTDPEDIPVIDGSNLS